MQYVQRSDCRAANLQSFAAARHFCSAKILAGGPPAQRNFQRKFALRRVGSARFVVPRLAITQKYVGTLNKNTPNTGQPQGARGTAVPLFREESRGTPSKGFLWATSSRRLDTALLFADKKRGVETYQAGRVLPVNPWSLDHRISKPRSIAPGLLRYSTVTLFARFLGLSISQPLCSAI